MSQTKKVIYETALIGNTNSDIFHQNINTYLTRWQNENFEVDIQFAANNNQALAFMIKYRMEPAI